MKIDITPLVLAFNEKENIARTLSALSWAKEIMIIDSGSTDGTPEIARSANPNVRIITRAFDTHGAQWNFGLQQVRTEWVLSLDADYELSSQLIEEISRLDPTADVAGYESRFEYRVFGRPLRASVYPPRVMLFRRDRATYYDDGHTQRLRTSGAVLPLSGLIYHDDRKPLGHWLRSQDRYAKLEALHLLSQPLSQLSFQDRLRRKIFFAAPAIFLYLLFARGVILDGWPGWLYVCQRTIAELLLSVRLLIEKYQLEPTRPQ